MFNMKNLIFGLLIVAIMPFAAFSQSEGVAVRSMNGISTNLALRSSTGGALIAVTTNAVFQILAPQTNNGSASFGGNAYFRHGVIFLGVTGDLWDSSNNPRLSATSNGPVSLNDVLGFPVVSVKSNTTLFASVNSITDTNYYAEVIRPSSTAAVPVDMGIRLIYPPWTTAGFTGRWNEGWHIVANAFDETHPDITHFWGYNADGFSPNEPRFTEQQETHWQNLAGNTQLEWWKAVGNPTNGFGTNYVFRWEGLDLVWNTTTKTFVSSDMHWRVHDFNWENPDTPNTNGFNVTFNRNKWGAVGTFKGIMTFTTNDNSSGGISVYGGTAVIGDTTGAKGFRLRYDYSGSIGHAGQSAIYEVDVGQGFLILGHTNISLIEGGLYLPGTTKLGTNASAGIATVIMGGNGLTNNGVYLGTGSGSNYMLGDLGIGGSISTPSMNVGTLTVTNFYPTNVFYPIRTITVNGTNAAWPSYTNPGSYGPVVASDLICFTNVLNMTPGGWFHIDLTNSSANAWTCRFDTNILTATNAITGVFLSPNGTNWEFRFSARETATIDTFCIGTTVRSVKAKVVKYMP